MQVARLTHLNASTAQRIRSPWPVRKGSVDLVSGRPSLRFSVRAYVGLWGVTVVGLLLVYNVPV